MFCVRLLLRRLSIQNADGFLIHSRVLLPVHDPTCLGRMKKMMDDAKIVITVGGGLDLGLDTLDPLKQGVAGRFPGCGKIAGCFAG
jgi:hypothetical protein